MKTPVWTTHSLWVWSLLNHHQIPLVYILVRLWLTADHPTHWNQHLSAMQKDSEGKSHVDLGCDMMDGFDRLLWRLRQRERKGSNPSMVRTLDEAFCVEKNDCVQGKRSKEGFWSSLKEAYWLTARRWIDLYGVHGSMMDFFLDFLFFSSQQSLKDKSPGKGAGGV